MSRAMQIIAKRITVIHDETRNTIYFDDPSWKEADYYYRYFWDKRGVGRGGPRIIAGRKVPRRFAELLMLHAFPINPRGWHE